MKLTEVEIKGYKSIDPQGQKISLGGVAVLLGVNGSGKSNLVSFFKMLNYMMTNNFQAFVGRYGVERLLYYGPKNSDSISFVLRFDDGDVRDDYEVKISYALPSRLFISEEKILYFREGNDKPYINDLCHGAAPELALLEDKSKPSRFVKTLLTGIRAYQFHDTSDESHIRGDSYIDNAKYLLSDAGNLAAFMRSLKITPNYKRHYDRIVSHIKSVMPQFGDFSLDPRPGNENYVRLNWMERGGNGYIFGPDQISDGSLRFMALAALLLQPKETMPKLIVIDEPELGLHPSAIAELACMVKTASANAQILLATQSPRLVDEFDANQIVVVERDRKRRRSIFTRKSDEELSDWLQDYSLSELWEKNVLGDQS